MIYSDIVCIDLDGTLIYNDLQFVYAYHLLYYKPMYLLKNIPYIFYDRVLWKKCISDSIYPCINKIKFIDSVREFILEKKYKYIVLATGAHIQMANYILPYLKIKFDEVIASTNVICTGKNKAKILAEKFKKFDYIGNSIHDIHVWNISYNKIAVVKKYNFFLQTKLQAKYNLEQVCFIYK